MTDISLNHWSFNGRKLPRRWNLGNFSGSKTLKTYVCGRLVRKLSSTKFSSLLEVNSDGFKPRYKNFKSIKFCGSISMRLHWSKIRYYQKFWEQFQQKGSPYENFSFFYQLRLDESLILSKEEKEKKNLLNMWEKTTLIFTWNNKPSTYYYIYIVESQDVKQTFGFCILEEIGHSRELYNLCVCDVSWPSKVCTLDLVLSIYYRQVYQQPKYFCVDGLCFLGSNTYLAWFLRSILFPKYVFLTATIAFISLK